MWDKSDPRRAELIARRPATADDVAAWVKEVCGREQGGLNGQDGLDGIVKAKSRESTKSTTSTAYAETAANAALVLIAVACSLLDRQLEAQAKAFENEGGFTERLYRQRQLKRRGSGQK